MKGPKTNSLFYGDNLEVLREEIQDESVDLIYLDPPFNSNANYNVLFKSPKGDSPTAQVEAFEDTWHWGQEAEREFSEILNQPNIEVSKVIDALSKFLGKNDMMAYLVMMANRLLELHRVLKPEGSLYLHCDPTASHYLKIVLDAVFSPDCFQSEIIWRRTGSHNKASRWAPIHDTIFFFTKNPRNYTWNYPKRPYMKKHVTDNFVPNGSGGWRTNYYGNVLTGAGTRNGKSGKVWKGFDPTAKGRHWAIPGALWEDSGIDPTGLDQIQKLNALFEAGYIKIEEGSAWPIYERGIRPTDGPAAPDIWAFQPYTEGTVFGTEEGIDADVSWLKPKDQERLGYPTQKPISLLERIIAASSKPGDVVLDPFCGCGTAVHAAEKLERKWIGIDITHLSISLIEKRLRDAFPQAVFDVHGTPKDIESARDLALRDKYQFQWWACSLVNAQPYQGKKKGADGGIDGLIYFQDDKIAAKKIIVSIKGGNNIRVNMIRELAHVVERENAAIGLFVTLSEATKQMLSEATKAGFYESKATKKNFPKIQILTIDSLLKGLQRPLYPDLGGGGVTFKKARREQKKQIQKDLF
ncbi:DNA methyltransferase [Pseudomonas pseudonitroreducens]|uniref:DNA methyltransferase n=1 Tax=Pseudomonas pseudonitroreducens TaxID=2892326 RepID=UPI001F295D1C|nr:DNA methyltransferase [Pseudomonas pseudonitroreducens]